MIKTLAAGGGLALVLAASNFAIAATSPNADIRNAAAVGPAPYTTAVDLYDAPSVASASCFDAAPVYSSVWYSFTPASAASLDAALASAGGAGADKYLALYTGTPGALKLAQCLDVNPRHAANSIRFTARPGVTYYLQVGAFKPVASGDIPQLTLAASPAARSGSLSPSAQATAYSQAAYDSQGKLQAQNHVAFDVRVACAAGLDSVSVDASLSQAGNRLSGYTQAACTAGSALAHFDLASSEAINAGAATVDLSASDYDTNYSAAEAAPITIALRN